MYATGRCCLHLVLIQQTALVRNKLAAMQVNKKEMDIHVPLKTIMFPLKSCLKWAGSLPWVTRTCTGLPPMESTIGK